ncbi:MAG: hypothetical protein RLZZ522_1356 [Verrucomicrobiota bacterium]|jgi:hypothetical protein
MPTPNSDPEKYSIDEMMERLKGNSSGNSAAGELVTREDGTQAIRVRKRKRRSDQPKRDHEKRQRRLRVIQVTAALVALILLCLFVGGAFIYSNTPAFRKSVSNAVASALGGTVEFKMFRVTPVSANAEAVDLTWPEGNGIKAVKLRGITSKISPLSLFGKSLKGEELSAREGEIFLQAPTAAAAPAASGKSLRFKRVAVTKLNITAGNPALPALKLTATEAALNFDDSKPTSSLKLHHGNLAIAEWPAFRLERAVLLLQPDAIELGLRVNDSLSPRGSLDLTGTLHPLDPTQQSTLAVKLDNFNLADLLGLDVGKLIDARIDTRQASNSNVLAFRADSLASVELSIAFRNTLTSRVTLTGFPFLLSLGRTLGDKWYEQPVLEESLGTIVRKGDTLELRNLNFERKTHMAVKGNLVIEADKALSGSLEIGVPESVVQLSPNLKAEAIFSPVQDGFRWLSLTIGGTLAHPTDNFAAVYAAAKDRSPAVAPASAEPGGDPGKAFEDLTRPADR